MAGRPNSFAGRETLGVLGKRTLIERDAQGIPFLRGDPSPRGGGVGGKSPLVIASGVPLLAKGCFSESSATGSGLFAPRHVVDLGKFTGAGAAVEFINCFLGEILPSGDVVGCEPPLSGQVPHESQLAALFRRTQPPIVMADTGGRPAPAFCSEPLRIAG